MPLSGFQVSTFCGRIVHDLSCLRDKPTVSFISIFPGLYLREHLPLFCQKFKTEKPFLEFEALLKGLKDGEL